MEEILDDLEYEDQSTKTYKYADKGKRFTNHIVDIFGYYVFSLIIGGGIGVVALAMGQEDFLLEEPSTGLNATLLDWLFGYIIITIYYTVSEYTFKGKTLGKLITKTRAVTEDNQRMDLETTFKRSLIRLVPFEAFSFLGDGFTGWHDNWSKTKVIEDVDWKESDAGFIIR